MSVRGALPQLTDDAFPDKLAHRPSFVVGPLEVQPSTLSIRSAEGSERVLQPLAMRVLGALAEARGETCSRDDLLTKCWGRTVVGDDALHRIISNLRRDLASVAGGALRLETIAKVGYRLRVDQNPETVAVTAPPSSATSATPPVRNWPRTPKLLWGALAAITVLATTAAALTYQPAEAVTIAVGPVASASGGMVDVFADDLTTDLARLASPMTGLTFIEAGPQAGRSHMRLRISLGGSEDGPESHVRLVDGKTGAVIWSRDFEAQGGSLGALRERVAYAVAGVIQCGLDRSTEAYDEPVSRRLYLSACEAVDTGDYFRAHSFAEQIVALRPDAAASWACLALTTIYLHPEVYGRENPRVKRATAYARRALDLDPQSGMAHLALAQALAFQGKSNISTIEEGISLDPDHAWLQRSYAESLMQVGFVKAAILPSLRALALQPHYPGFYDRAFYTLLSAGRHEEAVDLHRLMQRLWRDDPRTAAQSGELLFYSNDPAAALAEFTRRPPAADETPELLLESLRWRADPASYDWARFDRLAERLFAANRDAAWHLSYAAARMQDKPRALAWLERSPVTRSGAWAVLFATDAAELRREPQFLAKMAELGLVEFWRQRDRWPDFCSDEANRYDCRHEAERLVGRRSSAINEELAENPRRGFAVRRRMI